MEDEALVGRVAQGDERGLSELYDRYSRPVYATGIRLGRSPTAARQLASRARRRVQGAATIPDADLARQREVVDAFLAAARDGDFDALLAVLDPDVVLRSDGGVVRAGLSREVRGAQAVAEQALTFSKFARSARARPALVNGAAGVVSWSPDGRPFSVMGCTVRHGKIVEIDVLADPARLRHLDLAVLDD
jgi:ketosteroid isomerase-like protein